MRRQEQVGGNSLEPIHVEQQLQLEAQAETVFFSHGSLCAVGAMLTLAVLFCIGVLAYTVRRNDMLKAEYHRLMAAIAERASKTSRIPTESEQTDTMETMGPAPAIDDVTQDAILLLLTHKPISNIEHPGRTRRTTTTRIGDGETLYYDDLEGRPRRTSNGTRTATPRTATLGNHSEARTSPNDAIAPKSSATPIATSKRVPNATLETKLEVRRLSTATFMSTERTTTTGEVTRTSEDSALDGDRNSTRLGWSSDAYEDISEGAGDDA